MPTVQQIIDDIKVRVPNSFTNAQIIGWLNEGMRKLYKYMNSTTFEAFTTVANQSIYLLPENCTFDQVLEIELTTDLIVTVDSLFTSYTYAEMFEKMQSNKFFDGLSNNFGLYPIPTVTGWNGRIFFGNKPQLITSNDLNYIPEINEDYQDTIKYYALSIIASAGRAPNISLSNIYKIMFNDMMSAMFKDRIEKQIKTPKKNRANKWW